MDLVAYFFFTLRSQIFQIYNFDVVHVTSPTIRLFYCFIYYYVNCCTLGGNIEKKPKSIFFSREEFKAEEVISCTTS